jgi:protein-S-isoprenylcysteine O-methyltransferase Ste14
MKSGDRRPFGSRATNEIVITRCVTVTLALAYLVVSAMLVAVTVRSVPSATPARERSPVVEMLPADADQVTAVFVVFMTVAVNCSVPADGTETDEGEMVTVTASVAVTVTVAVAVAEPPLPVAVAV